MRPQKIPGKAAPTWSLKMLNRIRVFPQNLALGMKTHKAMMEMYLAGVSVRRIEDITEALWGARVSAGTISNLNKKIYGDIEEWRNLPLEAEYPYIYMDGIWLKRSWGGTVENVSILVAVGVNKEGYREVPGAAEGSREDAESWKNFCRYLKERGLRSAKLIVSDKSLVF